MRTGSGATTVQIAESVGGRRRIITHIGSAHTEAELGLLLEQARALLDDSAQERFDLGVEPGTGSRAVHRSLCGTSSCGP